MVWMAKELKGGDIIVRIQIDHEMTLIKNVILMSYT